MVNQSRSSSASRPEIAALCDEHGYPTEIRRVIEAIVEEASRLEPRSILLHGSAARGELTWWRDSPGSAPDLRIGSDVEMYFVGDRLPSAEDRARLNDRLDEIASGVNRGGPALFHIDVGFTTPAGLRAHPRTFRAWDTRVTGRTIYGEDVRDCLPELDAGSIDLRQLNEVPIHRLWEMAFRVPEALIRGGDGEDHDLFRLICTRQALDLTTWLFPHLGRMTPTFAKRVSAWEEEVTRPPLRAFYGPDSAPFLKECLRGKLHLRFDRPAPELHARVVDHFRAALRLLLGTSPAAGDEEISAAVLRQGRAHWNVEPPRRRLYEGYLLIRDRQPPTPRTLRWWARMKRPYQVAFLLALNASLQSILAGEDATPALDRAEKHLADLWYGYTPEDQAGTLDRFLRARRGYVDYLVRTSRWFGPRRAYLYSVIDNQAAS